MKQDDPGDELERRPPPLPPLTPMDWRSFKKAMGDRYDAEVRIVHGAIMTGRAIDGVAAIKSRIVGQPDEIDELLVRNFAFSAAKLIQGYMCGDA